MVSSALGGGGVLETGVTGRDRSAATLAEAAGVILILLPSDCWGSGRGEGAVELGLLVGLDCDREGSGGGFVCEGLPDSAPSAGAGGVGFPSFARRLLRIWES